MSVLAHFCETSPHVRLWLKIAVAIVLATGSLAAFRFVTHDPAARKVYNLDVDTSTYDSIARQLSTNWDLRAVPPSQPPGFVVFLGVIYSIAGNSYLAVKLTLWVLFMLTVGLAAVVMWRNCGPLEGLVTAVFCAFSPVLVAYAATLQYEMLAAFLTTLIVAVLVTAPANQNWPAALWRAIGIALLCSIAALVREVLLVLFPIAVASVITPSLRSGTRARALVLSVAMSVVVALPIGLWSLVQYRNTGRVVLISEKSDLNLQIGNNPAATGAYHLQLRPIAEPAGWAFIRQQPGASASLAGRKVLYFWGVLREPWTVPQQASVWLARATMNVIPFQWLQPIVNGALLTLFVIGVASSRLARGVWPATAAVIAVQCVHVAYFSSERFAVPVQPQIHMLAAVGMAAGLRAALRHTVTLVCAGLLIVWCTASQLIWTRGIYRVHAAELEGISANNVTDPLASGRLVRLGDAARRRRPIAFLSAAAFPRGSFALSISARAGDCSNRDRRQALRLTVRSDRNVGGSSGTLTVRDLCASPGYKSLSSIGTLREDAVIYASVTTSGAVDVFVDSVEITFGLESPQDLVRQ